MSSAPFPVVGAGGGVTGLPAGMKWTNKNISDKILGLIPANSFYGVVTAKPGFYTVFFTKTVDRVKHVVTATFEVGPLPVLTVNILGPGTGKVTGAGAYAANKTNGSAPIIPTCLTYEFDRGDATSTAMVYVYLPPKDGKFAGHVKSIKLQWDKLRFTEVAP